MYKKIIVAALIAAALFSCKEDTTKAVQSAMDIYQKTPSRDNYTKFLDATKNFAGTHAEDHANCFKYLSAASQAAARFKDSQDALKMAGDAVSKHGQGQNLSEPMTTIAMVFRDVTYKDMSTLRFEQPDFDRLNSLLKNNIDWLDSALVGMKKRLVTDSTNRIDKDLAMRYAYTADAAATVRNDPERSPALLMAGAEAAIAGESYLKAISIYDRVGTDWPGSKKAPQAAFMRAFLMENNMNDLPNAKKAYEEFLKKYPTDEFADDARAALKNLGKSPEELVKEFEKMNKK